jgi:hypothetical protein
MNRRKFIQTSGLAAISALILNNKLSALNFSNKYFNHLWIDLGAVRFQDVICKQEQSAMPKILQLISKGNMLVKTYDNSQISNKAFISNIIDNISVFELNSLEGEAFNAEAEFYDTFLTRKSVETILHYPQNLYVRIHQTEMAHYNIPSYRLLLSQLDNLISHHFNQLNQAKIQIHIYSSSGRNLLPDEYGGLHHHESDINTTQTFYIQSNPTLHLA